MSLSFRLVFVSCVLFSLFLSSASEICKSQTFTNGKTYCSCSDLPVLDSFIHFTYVGETGVLNLTYRHTNIQPSSWIAWAINPTGKGMIGAQALVAYENSVTGIRRVYTSPITDYSTTLQENPLSFTVKELSVEYADNEITIFAVLVLPQNTIAINHLWQDGPVYGDVLGMHSTSRDHLSSMGTLNLLSGKPTGRRGPNTKMLVEKIHGVLNMMSWGILMPIGVMVARYMRMYERAKPLWFYVHGICQTVGYIIGLFGGLGTALYMWRSTRFQGITTHSMAGIILFCLGFLQILAFKARPNERHPYRKYWNLYHLLVGYIIIIISITNVYKGLAILEPGPAWRPVYTLIIVFLVAVAVSLETSQWKRRWGENSRSFRFGSFFCFVA